MGLPGHQSQKLFERVVPATRSIQIDRFTGKTQPVLGLGQPIDLAIRFTARELPGKTEEPAVPAGAAD